jgi:hypothetical protein
MLPRAFGPLALSLMIVASSVLGANAGAAGDIAPTGLRRVAVAVGPAASAFWATRDPATGKPRGVTVELAKAAAGKLGVPLQLIEYSDSGEIAAASNKDAWDSSFMPADAGRERFVDQDRPTRAATRDWAAHFLEDAKADGAVRRALDSSGFLDAKVAS